MCTNGVNTGQLEMMIDQIDDHIRSRTYSAFMPLMAAAVIYLVMVMIFTYFVQRLERRLRSSDH